MIVIAIIYRQELNIQETLLDVKNMARLKGSANKKNEELLRIYLSKNEYKSKSGSKKVRGYSAKPSPDKGV
jgi:hypothetical protein